MTWRQLIDKWRSGFAVDTQPPLDCKEVESRLLAMNCRDDELQAFYAVSNGLSSGWLVIFPFFDKTDPKHTWQSLERVNDPGTSDFLSKSEELHARFFVFATVGGGKPAVIDRNDNTIWFEDDGELCQTDMSLPEFIDACLREVQEPGSKPL